MKTTVKFIASLALGACVMGTVAGCVEDDGKLDESDVKGGPEGKAEAWGSSDNPALFSGSLEFNVAALPQTGQATKTPWAGNYWPVYQDSINDKWDGANSSSPSAKYGSAFSVTGVEDAVSQYHGIDAQRSRTSCTTDSQCNATIGEKCAIRVGQTSGRCIPTWWGICHAWAPAAIILPEPKKPVTYNGVTFKVQDLKALGTLVFDKTETKFVSLRCDDDETGDGISFDKYGRPLGGAGNACIDTNPGTYHVLITNYLGLKGESFVEDRTYDDEVWNQPLRGYTITEQREITAVEANKLVGVLPEGGTTTNRTGSVAKSAWNHVGAFAVTAGSQLAVSMTGTGDPDLHVRFGSQPTATAYDCRPYANGATEACNVTVPAGATQAFVSVLGYEDTNTFNLAITAGGQVPTTYQFNANAKKFYKVHMDVQYISESPENVDGNLSSTIDRYTHTDNYDYVLETDATGKIIGGEWTGASKKAHPDFVWLPVRSTVTTVAGGKITYANVKMLLDLSVASDTPVTPGVEKVVNDSGAIAKSAWKQLGPFKLAAGATLTATMTGDGDADLYVRKSAAPTSASYDCRPYQDGTNESCSIVGPADVYVGINGYDTTSNYALVIRYVEGGGTVPPPPPPPMTITHLDTTGNVALNEMKAFSMDVIAGRKIVIRTFASVDIDLYVQFGAAPTTSAYVGRGFTSTGNETVSYTPTSSGKLHIGVHGYKAGAFTLRTADQ